MTNEEASCVLHCPDAYGGIYGQKYGAALAHCFELLEQEPCEDCVSREAVHNLIIPWLNDYLLDETREALETIDYKIEDLLSVKPHPKTGHWIDEPYYKISEYGEEDTYYTRKCSECFEKYDVAFNYCPNCGCRMIESEDKEDM